MPAIICENLRSAYNVGNIVRTADALGYDVIISGYSPSPLTEDKVKKTSLGAEEVVDIKEFWNTKEALDYAKNKYGLVIAAELGDNSASLSEFSKNNNSNEFAIVMGNEVEGVLEETLKFVDETVFVPMLGTKESMNVGQAAAIFMWELKKYEL